MRSLRLGIIPALLAAILCITPAAAQDFSIVATVNGEPVTNYALKDRVNAMIKAARLENTAETRSRLSFQALQSIINEKLQHQDAEHLGISVSDGEIDRAISDLRESNRLSPAQFAQFLERQSLSREAFREQVGAQLLWKKIAARKVAPRLVVTEDEINEAVTLLAARKEMNEVLLSEILIPATEDHEEKAMDLARDLVRKLRDGGADFKDLARQFSAGSTAGDGGRIGWIQVQQLRGDLRDVISKTAIGGITNPMSGEGVYRIFKIEDARTSSVTPDPGRVRESLLMQKMELEARRYMKELRQQAVIDIRI